MTKDDTAASTRLRAGTRAAAEAALKEGPASLDALLPAKNCPSERNGRILSVYLCNAKIEDEITHSKILEVRVRIGTGRILW